MKNTFNTIMSILILVVLAAGVYFIVETVRETAAAASQPIEQVNQANYALQTQMAQLMNPTPTIIPDPVTYINEIRALARLETIQYSVSQVMTGEDRQGTLGFAFGTKILVVVHGSVIAGIDMEKIQPGDMRLENGILYVNLPPAEILAVTLDTEKVEVYTLQEGLLADVDPTLVLQTIQGGQDKILSVALDDGILLQAEQNAEAYLLRFFSALGYDTVIFPQD
ncbi:MAG: DUF4230 domain-containing protein [Anaerolineales bacterium]|nr:DUF4230 domain-containing protein [Anaerolineales bacterium]MCE7861337.1 DUF4230 domain-containing protein [Chloroflexi bacterium CFX2]MCK6584130.1 DUF4230 domain-containing protein [Anaerolineales bacterium]